MHHENMKESCVIFYIKNNSNKGLERKKNIYFSDPSLD